MNIISHSKLPRLPQFSSDLKDPQTIEITYTAAATENTGLGEIPDYYEDYEDFGNGKERVVGKHLYKAGEEFHKNAEGHTQSVRFDQPVRESNGSLVAKKSTKYFSYNPDTGLAKRRAKGSLLGAALGSAAGAAVSLIAGTDLVTSIMMGTTVGTGAGALSQWNSKAPIPTIEWAKKEVEEAKLVGYEHSQRPWVECSFRGDSCWPVVDNNYEPILKKNVVGSFFEPVLKSSD